MKFVPEIDIEEGKMIIDPIKGMLDDQVIDMRFHIMTLFPEIFNSYMNESIMKRAIEKGIIDCKVYNIRDFSENKHKKQMIIHLVEEQVW